MAKFRIFKLAILSMRELELGKNPPVVILQDAHWGIEPNMPRYFDTEEAAAEYLSANGDKGTDYIILRLYRV